MDDNALSAQATPKNDQSVGNANTTSFPPAQASAIHNPGQNTQQPPIQQIPTVPQGQVGSPAPSLQSTPDGQAVSASPIGSTAPAPAATSETSKITLDDLYGPSSQAQPPPVVKPQQVQQSQVEDTPSVSQMPPRRVEENLLSDVQQTQTAQSPKPPSLSLAPEKNAGDGGFHLPPIVLKVIGGLFIILLLIVIVSFISSLFNKNTSSGKVTLTYWGLWEDSNVMQGIISDFERQNPNITINYTKEDPVKYTDRLLARIQNGNGPDIFRFHSTWVDPLENILLPLPSTVIDEKQLKDNYFPVIMNDLVRNGAIYGLPLDMDTLVMYTNKAIFSHAGAKVPTTWEDFVTVAKGLTVKDSTGHIKTSGAAMGTYDNVTHAPDIISMLLLQNGANLQKLDGSQNAIDALNFYTSFSKTDDRVWDSTLDNSLLAFERGNLAMYFGYSYDYFAIKAASPQLNFEIHEVPNLPGRDMSVASYWVEGVSSKSTHQKEALLFMKYLAQKDIMARLYTEEAKTRQFGEIYPRIDLAKNLSADPILLPFVSQAQKTVSSFFVSDTNYAGYNDALNQYLGNAINSMLNDTSADSAISTLAQGVSQIFNQYAVPSK